MSQSYKGSCLCGAVELEANEFLPEAAHGHCAMCRKFHGAAYATIASVRREQFRWIIGEEVIQRYKASNGTVRSFCKCCGSSLIFFSPKGSPDVVEVALGVFDDQPPIVPDAHIYVASGASWVRPRDGLICYESGRDSAVMELID